MSWTRPCTKGAASVACPSAAARALSASRLLDIFPPQKKAEACWASGVSLPIVGRGALDRRTPAANNDDGRRRARDPAGRRAGDDGNGLDARRAHAGRNVHADREAVKT